jgi:DNA-binding CsgD family transcriptional regulator
VGGIDGLRARRRPAGRQRLTNKEVAERLYISPHTVSGHLRHAFEKLGINSRVALTRIAAEHAR